MPSAMSWSLGGPPGETVMKLSWVIGRGLLSGLLRHRGRSAESPGSRHRRSRSTVSATSVRAVRAPPEVADVASRAGHIRRAEAGASPVLAVRDLLEVLGVGAVPDAAQVVRL